MTDTAIRRQAAADYEAIRSSILIDTPVAMLVIGENTTAVAQGHTPTAEEVILLDIGTMSITENCFKSTPPSPLDLERAIHWIEEAISRPRKLSLSYAILYLTEQTIQEIQQHLRGDKTESTLLTIEDIETAFTHLVSAAQVASASSTGAEQAAHSAADLLIVRELAHHWKFYAIATR